MWHLLHDLLVLCEADGLASRQVPAELLAAIWDEVAQSRCCFGTPVMAKVWLHNGFLQVEGEKMSKSLGNFITIRDVLDDWPGEVVDQLEGALPGVTVLYLQGTCGDVNFRREYNSTGKRFEPARAD